MGIVRATYIGYIKERETKIDLDSNNYTPY